MPTILEILGWRVFFYSNEGHGPIHVHARKGNIECKYWIDVANYDIVEACAYNLGSRDRRQVRRIIFDHFDYIVEQWEEFQRRRSNDQGA